MRLCVVIFALAACSVPAPVTDGQAARAESRPELKGNRLIAPSSERVAQPLEVAVTSPVAPGDTATATVMAPAGSRCTIEVTYRSGVSEAQGLDPATAGEDGDVSWTWIVGINTTPGDWVVAVECEAPDGGIFKGHTRLAVASVE